MRPKPRTSTRRRGVGHSYICRAAGGSTRRTSAGGRHHLLTHRPRLSPSAGGEGLGEPRRIELATVQHDGRCSASQRSRRWRGSASRRSLTPSPARSNKPAFKSRWMAAGGGWTMCPSNGCALGQARRAVASIPYPNHGGIFDKKRFSSANAHLYFVTTVSGMIDSGLIDSTKKPHARSSSCKVLSV
jgi:hypothetical protein